MPRICCFNYGDYTLELEFPLPCAIINLRGESMAIQTRREREWRLTDLWNRPIEWFHTLALRFLGWFNQERWTALLTIVALVLTNSVVLLLFLQGQEQRAIAFVVLIFIIVLALTLRELSTIFFIVSGAGLFVHTTYYAIGEGGGWTGGRTITLALFLTVLVSAIYEYSRLPRERRPRLITPLTGILIIYWLYHLAHVAYIYLFHYHTPPASEPQQVLGYQKFRLMRYHDYHLYWIAVPLLMILLYDWKRARRVMWTLSIITGITAIILIWEYLSPLPTFVKVMFQLQAAGETTEGYRVRSPASMYLIVTGFFAALYMLGYTRGWKSGITIAYLVIAIFAILITKNRILWAGILAVLPFALLLKSPQALLRQTQLMFIGLLLVATAALHPALYDVGFRIVNEAAERWSRNYAFANDPTLDPSYQGRVREREAWERTYAQTNMVQRLFGLGLEATYGRYITLADAGYVGPRFHKLYYEKVHMHFAWLDRLLKVGLIGTILLALVFVVFYVRSAVLFAKVKTPQMRAIIIGLIGGTTGLLAFDALHTALPRDPALPVILCWALVELIPYWETSQHHESRI
ncbi:MAG: hypothetical protein KatS3mg016_1436 [Fimbriimonadales bacterium]|nr:MAG: hypothetical protein KatS3mg016_1436 [Fimbriimonadales bacterium]